VSSARQYARVLLLRTTQTFAKKHAPVILSPRSWAKDLSSVLKLPLRQNAVTGNQNYVARAFRYFFHGSQ
jgi:hypothetical protein